MKPLILVVLLLFVFGLLLLAIALPAQAVVTVTELTTGGSTGGTGFTTASVSPTAGDLLLLFFAWRTTGCALSTVAGMSLTWTQVIESVQAGGIQHQTVYRALSTGTTGTITVTWTNTANCYGRTWVLLAVRGADTTTNQGVVSSNTAAVTACANCLISYALPSYSNASNAYIAACSFGSIGSSVTFTFGNLQTWTTGTNVNSGSTGSNFQGIQAAWLLTRTTETANKCITAGGGAETGILNGVEIAFSTAAAGVRHRSTQD
jgi:hypothetical protein